MVETYHPHLMVTDIVMPRMNGYELVRRVVNTQDSAIPVIFLSGQDQERIQGYQSGADLYSPSHFEVRNWGQRFAIS